MSSGDGEAWVVDRCDAGEGEMKSAESVDQIHGRVFNPPPAITHCPCGHPLEECLRVSISGEGCRILDTYYSEFLKMVPDWFLIAATALCEAAAAHLRENPNSESWDLRR